MPILVLRIFMFGLSETQDVHQLQTGSWVLINSDTTVDWPVMDYFPIGVLVIRRSNTNKKLEGFFDTSVY